MSLPLHGKINPINFFVEGFSVFEVGFSSQALLGSTMFRHVVVNLIWCTCIYYYYYLLFILLWCSS